MPEHAGRKAKPVFFSQSRSVHFLQENSGGIGRGRDGGELLLAQAGPTNLRHPPPPPPPKPNPSEKGLSPPDAQIQYALCYWLNSFCPCLSLAGVIERVSQVLKIQGQGCPSCTHEGVGWGWGGCKHDRVYKKCVITMSHMDFFKKKFSLIWLNVVAPW